MTPVYALHGLRVRSEVPLAAPLADTAADGPGAPEAAEIEIVRGPRQEVPEVPCTGRVLLRLERPGIESMVLSRHEAGYTLRLYGCCEFEIDRRLERISVHLAPQTDDEFPSVWAASLLAAVMALRGLTVLHASAVEQRGAAVAFIGFSGQGKTTLAALCCAAGARLVSDDVLRVECDGDAALCHRGSGELRLRAAAHELAGLVGGEGQRCTMDERIAVAPPLTELERPRLAAVVAPACSADAKELELERLRGARAATVLLRFPRTVAWVDAAPAARDFAVLTELARLTPVYRATLPAGPPFPVQRGARLLASVLDGTPRARPARASAA